MIQNRAPNGLSIDVNLALAGLLYDLAYLAGGTPRAFGYKRAALQPGTPAAVVEPSLSLNRVVFRLHASAARCLLAAFTYKVWVN